MSTINIITFNRPPAATLCSSKQLWGRCNRPAEEARLHAFREWELAYVSWWSEWWGWWGGLAPGGFSTGQWPVVPPKPRWALHWPHCQYIYLWWIIFDKCICGVLPCLLYGLFQNRVLFCHSLQTVVWSVHRKILKIPQVQLQFRGNLQFLFSVCIVAVFSAWLSEYYKLYSVYLKEAKLYHGIAVSCTVCVC